MSRTYRKYIRCFTCYGDNREYYLLRRRQRRRRENHEIRTLLANYGSEGIDELWKGADMVFEDQWNEPTDGHWAINKQYLKTSDRIHGYNDWSHKHFDRYLKPKNRKHYQIVE